MGLRFSDQKQDRCFFLTSTFRDWRPLGAKVDFYQALADSLLFYSKKYCALVVGYIFMPTHVHLILIIDGVILSAFMRDFKKFIAQKVASDLKLGPGGIWMPRYDRVAILDAELLRTKLNYIHFNPVKSGLVNTPEDWFWSSAAEYFLDRKREIPIYKNWI